LAANIEAPPRRPSSCPRTPPRMPAPIT
jgi:hypothetical protein